MIQAHILIKGIDYTVVCDNLSINTAGMLWIYFEDDCTYVDKKYRPKIIAVFSTDDNNQCSIPVDLPIAMRLEKNARVFVGLPANKELSIEKVNLMSKTIRKEI